MINCNLGDKRNDGKGKMHNGDLYLPNDPEIADWQLACLDKLYEFNQTRPMQQALRAKMLKEMFAEIGEGCYIEPPLHTNFGGKHCHWGSHVYANFNLTMVDDTHIYVGDNTMFGPNVVLATAGHPILPELRNKGYQYNASIRIGKNCWLGAGVIVMPGITIGDNVVIGAGSIVTKDSPSKFCNWKKHSPLTSFRKIAGYSFNIICFLISRQIEGFLQA